MQKAGDWVNLGHLQQAIPDVAQNLLFAAVNSLYGYDFMIDGQEGGSATIPIMVRISHLGVDVVENADIAAKFGESIITSCKLEQTSLK